MTNKKKKGLTKSASKPTTPVNQLRGAIGFKKDWFPLKRALESIKHHAGPGDFSRYLRLARVSPMLPLALASINGRMIGGLVQGVAPLEPTNLTREIIWVVTVLLDSSEVLGTFANKRDNFFIHLLAGEYASAASELDEIESMFGMSLWLVENRILLLSLQGGFEAQKAYVGKITKEYKRTFLSFFAANIGERNEARVTIKGYDSRVRERAKTWKIEPTRKSYIFYKLLSETELSPQETSDILAFESASSLIDLYETLVTLLCSASIANSISDAAIQALHQLVAIDDHRIPKLLALVDPNFWGQMQLQSEAIYVVSTYMEPFLCGKYQDAAAALAIWLMRNPDDVCGLVIAGQVIALGFDIELVAGSPVRLLAKHYADYFEGGARSELAAEELEKLALNLKSSSIGSSLVLPIRSRTASGCTSIALLTAESAIKTPIYTAQVIHQIGPKFADLYGAVNPQIVDDFTWQYQASKKPASEKLSIEANSYLNLSANLASHRFDLALEDLRPLSASEFEFFKSDASIYKTLILFRMGDIPGALKSSVDLVIKTPAYARAVPLAEIVRPRGYKNLKELQGDLALPLAFFLYQEIYATRQKDISLKVAWRQLLAFHNVTKPSELADIAERFPKHLLIFFLEVVCTQEVMELGRSFKSPGDLDKERIQICKFLSSFNPDRAKEYGSEIVELTRRVSIEEGVKVLENSRIYVDPIGLDRWANDKLSELFLRYQDYSSAGLSMSVDELKKTLTDLLKNKNIAEFKNYLESYDVSAESLLEDMLGLMGAAFMSLPRYGLDSFLSSRVRHGSLVINLRGCFERRNLITKINSQTNTYEANTYWLDQIAGINAHQKSNLQQLLTNFSRDIDEILDTALKKIIHVRSESKPEGLLTLYKLGENGQSVTKGWVIAAKVSLPELQNLPSLLNYAINTFFWPGVTASLELAQSYIKNDLARKLVHSLHHLKSQAISAIGAESASWLVSNIDTAEEELIQAAERVSKWFNPPQKSELEYNYTVQMGIEIGLRSFQYLDSTFKPLIQWSVDSEADVRLMPAGFGLVNDLYFLIFGNIWKHAGFGAEPGREPTQSTVHVTVQKRGANSIEITVVNSLSPTCDRDEINKNVEDARKEIAERRFDAVVDKTNKSGLVRLAATLDYESFDEKNLAFGLQDHDNFFVRITLPPAALVLPDDH